MTYSARRFQPLTAALQAAVGRGVQVSRHAALSQALDLGLRGDVDDDHQVELCAPAAFGEQGDVVVR